MGIKNPRGGSPAPRLAQWVRRALGRSPIPDMMIEPLPAALDAWRKLLGIRHKPRA